MNSTRHFRLLNSEYAIKHIKRLKNKRGQLLSMVSLIPLAACGGGVNPFTVNGRIVMHGPWCFSFIKP